MNAKEYESICFKIFAFLISKGLKTDQQIKYGNNFMVKHILKVIPPTKYSILGSKLR